MKTLPAILVVMMLVGCAGMGTGGGADAGGSSSGSSSIEQWNKEHHNDPSDIYFGG